MNPLFLEIQFLMGLYQNMNDNAAFKKTMIGLVNMGSVSEKAGAVMFEILGQTKESFKKAIGNPPKKEPISIVNTSCGSRSC